MIIIISISLIFAVSAQTDPDPAASTQTKLTNAEIWGFGILAGIGVSLIGFLAAIVLVAIKRFGHDQCFKYFVKFFFALSSGALLGDAIVHILSQAYVTPDILKTIVSLIYLCSIGCFLLLERLFHALGIVHAHWVQDQEKKNQDQHPHNQIQQHPSLQQIKIPESSPKKQMKKQINQKKEKKQNNQMKMKNNQIIPLDSIENVQIPTVQLANNQSKEEEKNCCQSLKGKGASGYMNLVGSLIHNFIDGLAIGVSFASGYSSVFIPVLVAVIVHQIPRELGDVAVLMKSRFTGIQTILCNGIANLIAIIGAIVGLSIINIDQITNTYILVFVAGNFTYVAADIWRNLFKNKTFIKNALQFIGFAIGVGVMFCLLLLE